MRLIVRIFLIVVGLVAILFALNNRAPVDISFWPMPWEMRLPLFLVLVGALMLGIAIGAALAWAGQARHRRSARTEHAKAERHRREIEALRAQALQKAPQPGTSALPPPI